MDKIICLGKTYHDHALELGDAVPDKPVLFLKPPSAAVQAESWSQVFAVELLKGRGDVHYECEVAIRINRPLYRVRPAEALNSVDAVTVGLDLTLRDLQTKLKKQGHPWTTGKVFPGSAVLGPWLNVSTFPNYGTTPFSFYINGERKQEGLLSNLMLPLSELIAYSSEFFRILPGDVIFTGTPAGVGPVRPGDASKILWGDHQMQIAWS